jgi:hypothetical protein
MSDPTAPTTPQWTIREFQITTPFTLSGELEYQSWTDFEHTLSADIDFESLPQLRFEFGQNMSRLQAGLGLQLFKYELPHLGPWVAEIGAGAMVQWGEDNGFEVGPELEIRNVKWPTFSFSIEGAMNLSGFNAADGPQLGAEITGNLQFHFDLFAPRGTYRRRR